MWIDCQLRPLLSGENIPHFINNVDGLLSGERVCGPGLHSGRVRHCESRKGTTYLLSYYASLSLSLLKSELTLKEKVTRFIVNKSIFLGTKVCTGTYFNNLQ